MSFSKFRSRINIIKFFALFIIFNL